jgi:hypothetical protein
MSIRRTNPAPQPVHWSKDYVEHLRTVHFALIATAVALVIIALATKPYSTSVAARELRQIQDLRSYWSLDFIIQKLPSATVPDLEESEARGEDFLRLAPAPDKLLHLYVKKKNNPSQYDHVYLGHLPKIFWHEKCESPGFANNISLRKIPETVTEFRWWWNGLQAGCLIRYPAKLIVEGPMNPAFELVSPEDIISESDISRSDAQLLDVSGDTQSRYLLVGKNGDSFDQIPIRWTEFTETSVNTKTLATYLGLIPGPFNQTFRDLEEVSRVNGIESLTALQDTLSKSELSDAPVFEAFGIKFPASLAAVGGTAVLLSVQLYFLVYLRKLSGTLNSDDPGWDVPWVGMDSSVPARIIVLITVIGFPVVSLAVLSGEAAIRITRGYWENIDGRFHLAPISGFHWTVDLELMVMICAVLISACLGVMCWKYRPQVNGGGDSPGPFGETQAAMTDKQAPTPDPKGAQEADQT